MSRHPPVKSVEVAVGEQAQFAIDEVG